MRRDSNNIPLERQVKELLYKYPELTYHITLLVGIERICTLLEYDSFYELTEELEIPTKHYYHLAKKLTIHKDLFEEVLPPTLCKHYLDIVSKLESHQKKSGIIFDFSDATNEIFKNRTSDQLTDILFDYISEKKK